MRILTDFHVSSSPHFSPPSPPPKMPKTKLQNQTNKSKKATVTKSAISGVATVCLETWNEKTWNLLLPQVCLFLFFLPPFQIGSSQLLLAERKCIRPGHNSST